MIDAIEGLAGYSYLHSARADLLRRAGRTDGGGRLRTAARSS